MHKFLTAALAAAFLAGGAFATATADPGNGNGGHQKTRAAQTEGSEHARASARSERREWQHRYNMRHRSDRDERGNRARGNSGTAHNCANPSGNKRGWCKGTGTYKGRYGNRVTSISGTVTAVNGNLVTFQRDNGSTITVLDNNGTTLNVGSHYTLNGQMVNGQFVLGSSNGTYGQSNQTLTGTIMAVGNGTVTLIGLPPTTINVQQAINNGATNGSLSIGRSITAYGYYSNNVFYATAIR